jgi:hypothetical protein
MKAEIPVEAPFAISQARVLSSTPRICAVYFLYVSGQVVYVGCSTNLLARIASHLDTRSFDEVRYLVTPKEILAAAEDYWISQLNPPWNRPRGRPEALGKVRVVLKLRRETDKALYAAAGRANITKSEFVERAIEERLQRLKEGNQRNAS